MSDLSRTFEAYVYNPELGTEMVPGRISMDRWQLHFQSEELNLDIPYGRLRVRVTEGEDERVYFRDTHAKEYEIFTTDFDVLDHPHIEGKTNYGRQRNDEAARDELWRRVRLIGYVLGAFVVVVWMGQLVASAMARALVKRVPAAVEQSIGAEELAEIRNMGGFDEEPKRIASLEALAAPLTDTVKIGTNTLIFHIWDMDMPNAFAMGGGHVVVTTGLLKMLDTPEEVMGVIAHEIAHVKEKHLLRRALAAAGSVAVVEIFFGKGDIIKLAEESSGDYMVQAAFSQDFEIEADAVGWDLLVAANIDPRGEIEALKKLLIYESAMRGGDTGTRAFDSHPALEKRIAKLERKWRSLKKKDGFLDVSKSRIDLKRAGGI